MNKTQRIGRRGFLKAAGGLAAGAVSFPYVVPGSVLGNSGGTAASDRITMGFIGTGKQSKHLMRSFLNSPGTRVVAGCDVDKLKLARGKKIVDDHYKNKNCATYGDYRDLLARDDIDAVVIATPDHWHAKIASDAAEAGKDIYCEKPLTQSIYEARALVNTVRRYGRVFQVGSMQRSDWHFRLGCELVRNGYIGELKTVKVGIGGPPGVDKLEPMPVPDYLDWEMWVGPAPWRPYHSELSPHISWDGFPHWRYHEYYGGGGMTDWGAHHFDIAQWGMGMDESGPVEIIPPNGSDVEHLTYKYATGVVMTRESANGVLFEGTKGKVETNRGHLKTWPDELKDIKLKPNDIHLYESRNHYVDFLDAMRNRTKPVCDVETGARSVTVCHLGNIAYRLDRPLKWDPVKEEFPHDAEANRLLKRSYRAPWYL